ncbi:MAG: FAD-dependent oxidoreductase, partial [Polyangiales bacterium]
MQTPGAEQASGPRTLAPAAREHFDVIVIGGGQAGLSVGYHLKRQGVRFVILDASERIGDAWRKRWDSLRLFSPAWASGLDGLPFPGPRYALPTKDDMADYLESYAAHFELPVRSSTRV